MSAPKIVAGNPNASVAAGGTGVGVLIVWILGTVGVTITPEVGAVIAGAISTAVLYVGRAGIKGVIDRIWKGDK